MVNINRQLVLVIPKLLPALASEPTIKISALQTLLARADQNKLAYKNIQQILFNLFNVEITEELPIASLTALIDELPAAKGYWLRADLVELHADFSTVFLSDKHNLELTTAELMQLQESINQFFAAEKITFHAVNSKRAYLHLNENPHLMTLAPQQMFGKSINHYLPVETTAVYWRRLFIEMQMLLHNHPVNQLRLKHHQPLANALWFWGSGCLPKVINSDWQYIWTNNIVVQGLAKLNQKKFTELSEKFSDCLPNMQAAGNYLIVFAENATDNLNDFAATLEKNWFDPLLQAVRNQTLSKVTFYLDNELSYVITQKKLWRIWRRYKM